MYARTKNKKRTRDYFEGREDSRGRSRHRGEEVWNQDVIIHAYEQMNQLHQKNLKRLKTNGNLRSNAKSRGRSGTRAASKKASRKPSRKSSRRDYDVSDDDEIITLHQFPQVSQVRKTTGTKPDRGRKEESPSPLERESSKDRRTATEVCTQLDDWHINDFLKHSTVDTEEEGRESHGELTFCIDTSSKTVTERSDGKAVAREVDREEEEEPLDHKESETAADKKNGKESVMGDLWEFIVSVMPHINSGSIRSSEDMMRFYKGKPGKGDE
jgi:hypothetical protein